MPTKGIIMKLTILLFLLPFSVWSATFDIIGPCSSEPVFKAQFEAVERQNVGDITMDLLRQYKIPFIGNARAIQSLFNTPIGDNALEVLSDNEMRAFGWCYSLDGVEPGSYPNQVLINSKDSHISWYFGFAHYFNGQWIAQCTKSFTVKPDFLCL